MFTELSLSFVSTLPIIESKCAVTMEGVDLTDVFQYGVVIQLDSGEWISLLMMMSDSDSYWVETGNEWPVKFAFRGDCLN